MTEVCDRCKESFYKTMRKHIEFRFGRYGEPDFFSLCDMCMELWKPICKVTGYYEASELYTRAVNKFLSRET